MTKLIVEKTNAGKGPKDIPEYAVYASRREPEFYTGKIFEVDEDIFPMLQKLWGKGYETCWSCSGHVTPDKKNLMDFDCYIGLSCVSMEKAQKKADILKFKKEITKGIEVGITPDCRIGLTIESFSNLLKMCDKGRLDISSRYVILCGIRIAVMDICDMMPSLV